MQEKKQKDWNSNTSCPNILHVDANADANTGNEQ